MDLSGIVKDIVPFARENPLIAAAVALCVILLVSRKPKVVVYLAVLALLLGVLYWFVGNLSGKGAEQKKALIHKDEQTDPRF